MTSTPSASSWWANRSFSSAERLFPGACSPSRRVVSKITTSLVAIRAFVLEKGVNEKRREPVGSRRLGDFGGDAATVSRYSCRHAAKPSLTDKPGKEDAKEDDDEPGAEQHGGLMAWSVKVTVGILRPDRVLRG